MFRGLIMADSAFSTEISTESQTSEAWLDHNREAVGLFKDPEQMENAIRELEGTAFPRDSISILGHQHMLEERFGRASVDEYFDKNLDEREAPVRPEERTIGAGVLVGCATYIGVVSAGIALGPASLPVTLMAIVLGGGSGAAIGGLLLNRLRHQHEKHIQEQLAHGGMVLWVRTPDAERENIACDILKRHGATNVKIHDIP